MNEWFSDTDRFKVLTEVMQRSANNGTILKSTVTEERAIELLEAGVERGIFSRRDSFTCPRCDQTYRPSNVPDTCICGTDLPSSPKADITEYYSKEYPELLRDLIGDSIGSIDIKYDNNSIEGVKITNLEPVGSENHILHISPNYEIDDGYEMFSGHLDVFISWYKIPELIESPDEIREEVEDFQNRLDEAHSLADSYGGVLFDGGSGELNFPFNSDLYTLLNGMDHEQANKVADELYDMNYSSLYELLGLQYLSNLFPQTHIYELGNKKKPDGILIHKDRTFLVESKCYSNGFKLFSEEDKSARYIREFEEYVDDHPALDFNLDGYIFLSYKFKENALPEDILSFIERNRPDVNLDVLCIDGKMMRDGIEKLNELYATNPSAAYRIKWWTNDYKDIFNILRKNTELNGICYEVYDNNVLDNIIDIGKEEKTDIEELIERGFGTRSKLSTTIPEITSD